MATIFEEARRRREKALDEATNPPAPPPPAPAPPPAVDFFKPKATDPEVEAARQRAKARLLRNG